MLDPSKISDLPCKGYGLSPNAYMYVSAYIRYKYHIYKEKYCSSEKVTVTKEVFHDKQILCSNFYISSVSFSNW